MSFWKNLFRKKNCCGKKCNCSIQEKKEKLNLTDDDIEKIKNLDEKIIIGKVLSVSPHPDVSITKVRVTEVDLGTEKKQILCGGINVEENQIVPVATLGAKLSPEFEISVRQIKGVSSYGMICSRSELGLSFGEEKKGEIWSLPIGMEKFLGHPLKNTL